MIAKKKEVDSMVVLEFLSFGVMPKWAYQSMQYYVLSSLICCSDTTMKW